MRLILALLTLIGYLFLRIFLGKDKAKELSKGYFNFFDFLPMVGVFGFLLLCLMLFILCYVLFVVLAKLHIV